MKVALAQIQPTKGDIGKNIQAHIRFISLAIDNGANAIFFPELSLTGYEPALAKQLATKPGDERLNLFQSICDESNIVVAAGLPTISHDGIRISAVIFQPQTPRQVYSKQYLHDDELPYFIPGNKQLYITTGNNKIALAICYESLLPQHAEAVSRDGMNIYLASVAKSVNGVAKAYQHYPGIAGKYEIPVLMVNCVGYCDNFQSAGSSAAWSKKGTLLQRLDNNSEGLLIFDTETEEATIYPAEL